MSDDLCVFNGIDGSTGDYLVPPMAAGEVLDVLRQRPYVPTPRAMMPGLDPATSPRAAGG